MVTVIEETEIGTVTVTVSIVIEIGAVTVTAKGIEIGITDAMMTTLGRDTMMETTMMTIAANGDTEISDFESSLFTQGFVGGFLRFSRFLHHPFTHQG